MILTPDRSRAGGHGAAIDLADRYAATEGDEMRAKTTTVSALLVLAGTAGWPATALAAPAGAPSASSLATFDCGPHGTFTGFANSGSSGALTWNPFFLTAPDGSAAVLDPTANDLVVTYPGGVFAPDATKGGAPGAVTCQVSGGSGAVVVGGSVTGNLVLEAPAG